MLLPAPPLYPRKRKPKAKARFGPPPVGVLTLVSATYDQGSTVTLTFDRAVDVSGFELASLSLFDGPIGYQYGADGDVTVLSATTVRIGIVGVEEWIGTGVTLDVTSANGIVAEGGGGASWAGVAGVELPFP